MTEPEGQPEVYLPKPGETIMVRNMGPWQAYGDHQEGDFGVIVDAEIVQVNVLSIVTETNGVELNTLCFVDSVKNLPEVDKKDADISNTARSWWDKHPDTLKAANKMRNKQGLDPILTTKEEKEYLELELEKISASETVDQWWSSNPDVINRANQIRAARGEGPITLTPALRALYSIVTK